APTLKRRLILSMKLMTDSVPPQVESGNHSAKTSQMRAIAVIVTALVIIVITIVVRFYSAPPPGLAVVPDAELVPGPSQMPEWEYSASLTKVLEQSDPDVWHQVANGWNWDGGVAPLAWMIRQPQCDRGTALLIYWHGGPGWFKQYAGRDEVPAYLSLELF